MNPPARSGLISSSWNNLASMYIVCNTTYMYVIIKLFINSWKSVDTDVKSSFHNLNILNCPQQINLSTFFISEGGGGLEVDVAAPITSYR